ncbi:MULTISPECIES: ABC transporter ATP-binding protein [Actinoalloteichus]|uniref:ABC-type multidrug transport system, ATPase component n=1 Tax=Actinoalloteichus fjordicus TaxID=1612552 RepID=A0AAC9LGA0_9PSEU|nr:MULTISPECIES: ABC transporter ATP-binding protein [Actinoalloteichus]APU17161.1 ABC-type multidrug transport system, ATPase component [Actinoalloteichus fjordicus]APU23244.1 ABC-type multidrug transport system, ATPase component [Actinoalloteichus sp. GBA129-24]
MTTVIETSGLGKRFRTEWALRDLDLTVPAGSVLGLVGPNGAGKTTLMNLLVDLLAPTEGELTLFGLPAGHAELRERVGYLAQDHPLYRGFTVAEMLRAGRVLNSRWDEDWAQSRIAALRLKPRARIGSLSGGQQAQVALTIALAAKPDLLVLDEPVASMDPLARREFMGLLMEEVADRKTTVVISSHVVSELERVCDHLAVLTAGRLCLAGSVDALLSEHSMITCAADEVEQLTAAYPVIDRSDAGRQSTLLVRSGTDGAGSGWAATQPDLEELVLGYLRNGLPSTTQGGIDA